MLRPLYLDLLDVLLPLAAGLAALGCGRQLHRLKPALFRAGVGLAVLVIGLLGVSYFLPFPEAVNDALWHAGGETTVACLAALLLLGVVWSARGRGTSTGFLRALVAVIALVLVLHSGGRWWWRTLGQAAWQNVPDRAGCLTQSAGWTCSPAAASMLLHQYGIEASEGELAYRANTSFLGTDLRSIAQALTRAGQPHGLVARLDHADYQTCLRQSAPFFACVRLPRLGSHAVLVLRAGPTEVELVDPRFGFRQTVPRAELEPQWEGNVIRLEVAP